MWLQLILSAALLGSAVHPPSEVVDSAQGARLDAAEADRAALLGELEFVPAPGLPGCLAVFGEQAFSVLAYQRDGVARTVVAAARTPGGGRIVAFGHDGYLGRAALGSEEGADLLELALRWAGAGGNSEGLGGKSEGAGGNSDGHGIPLGADGQSSGRAEAPKAGERAPLRVYLASAGAAREPLLARGFEVAELRTLAPQAGVIVLGRVDLAEAERQALFEHLEQGGGLLCAATGWGWQQLHPGQDIALDLPLNRLMQPFGLSFSGASAGAEAGRFAVAEGRDQAAQREAHAGQLLDALLSGDLDRQSARAARGALVDAATAVPAQQPDFGTRLAILAEARMAAWEQGKGGPLSPDPLDALAVALLTRASERSKPADVRALPGIERFPGVVAGSAPDTLCNLPTGPRGWRSLGLWVPAGRPIHLKVDALPPGSRWRIGAHTDSLWHQERWQRWPEISRVFDGAERTLATPFGGLLYLELEQPNTEPILVRIADALPAPLLSASASPEEVRGFLAQIASYPEDAIAPWVELAGEHIVLTLPLDAARTLDDPLGVIAYWDRVHDLHSALLGRPIDDRPERFVFDVQIGGGWMHSGYPIMAYLPSAREAIDLDNLRTNGDWGLFHELGHNCQESAWTSSDMGEVTCNLFSLQAMEQMTGTKTRDVDWSKNLLPWLANHRQRIAAGQASFDDLRQDPGHMLAPFIELRLAFGWEPFTAFFKEHRAAAAGQDPRTLDDPAQGPRPLGPPSSPNRDQAILDQAILDRWALRLSHLTQHNLAPYLQSCGWPLTASLTATLTHLPTFQPEQE